MFLTLSVGHLLRKVDESLDASYNDDLYDWRRRIPNQK